jgi:hypothetical protein
MIAASPGIHLNGSPYVHTDGSSRCALILEDEPERKNPETRDSMLISCLERNSR